MVEPHHDDLGPELAGVARVLREERALPDAEVLERARHRARSQARRRGHRPAWTRTGKGAFMRSRVAITAMLTLGIMMMATSSGLALSGVAGDGSAGIAQYRNLQQTAPGSGSGSQDVPEDAETLGEAESGGEGGRGDADEGDLQATRQVSLGGDSADKLPFTGFAAIILLVSGLTLLTAGLALRRGAREQAT